MREDLKEAIKELLLYYNHEAEENGSIDWNILDGLVDNLDNAFTMQELEDKRFGV